MTGVLASVISLPQTMLVMTMVAISNSIVVTALVCAPAMITRQKVTKEIIGLQRLIKWRDIGYLVVGIVAYFILTVVFSVIAQAVVPGYDIDQAQELGFDKNLVSPLYYIVVFTVLVLIVPFLEELIFRGWLYGMLAQKGVHIVGIIIIVSLLFGVAHGQWNVGVDTAAVSTVACLLRYKTGAIWSGVLLHAAKNGLAFYFLFINPGLLGIIIY